VLRLPEYPFFNDTHTGNSLAKLTLSPEGPSRLNGKRKATEVGDEASMKRV